MRQKAARSVAAARRGEWRVREFLTSCAALSFRLIPGVPDTMNHGEIRTDGKNKQRDRHAIHKCAENHQSKAFRAFPKTDATALDQRFRARL